MSKIIMVSGGMDPIHVGHLRLIQAAAKHGLVLVVLNSDAWLERKKSYVFMPWEERKELLMSMSAVHNVVEVEDSDGTVCDALERWKPDYFGNGGDRTDNNTPEKELCEQLGIEMVWGLGGHKTQSSSDLVRNAWMRALRRSISQ